MLKQPMPVLVPFRENSETLLGDRAGNGGNGVVDIIPVCVFAYITGPAIDWEVVIDEP